MSTLLIGDATIYTASGSDNSNAAGEMEAYAFVAAQTGTVDTLMFRTHASTANTGVTAMYLGMFADDGTGDHPSPTGGANPNPLGSGSVSGTPGVGVWVTVGGLSIPVVSGTTYWLCALSIGAAIHNYYSGGTAKISDSGVSTHALIEADTWGSGSAGGPVGFQGLSTAGAPSQTILPDADITTTGWTPSTGATLYGVLDDSSDATYASATLS
jgi:hypothetical protein